mmetsp:Transcript_131115/g.226973  ORF Transcript_131115/g.226973 Transcript_131115/m.226973 type:complete len:222 (-) Transcript_131115:7-672(-)
MMCHWHLHNFLLLLNFYDLLYDDVVWHMHDLFYDLINENLDALFDNFVDDDLLEPLDDACVGHFYSSDDCGLGWDLYSLFHNPFDGGDFLRLQDSCDGDLNNLLDHFDNLLGDHLLDWHLDHSLYNPLIWHFDCDSHHPLDDSLNRDPDLSQDQPFVHTLENLLDRDLFQMLDADLEGLIDNLPLVHMHQCLHTDIDLDVICGLQVRRAALRLRHSLRQQT